MAEEEEAAVAGALNQTVGDDQHEDDATHMSEDEKDEASSSDSDEEDERAEEAHLQGLEYAVLQNPSDYDAHVQYIKSLRKYGQVEKLPMAREAMSTLFPLGPMMWQEWAKDEACLNTSPEAVSIIEQLYERGVYDYLSVPLWSDYLNFIQERDDSVLQCTPEGISKMRALFERALTASGLHIVEGGRLWVAYREFEQALLVTMEESDTEVKSKQVDRIRNVFRRHLSIPLADIDVTLEDYKAWEEEQGNMIGNDKDHLAGMPSNFISAYRKAVEMYKARAYHEEKLAAGKNADADADRLQNYLSYINFERSSGDPARVQVLYERAITEFPVVADLWLGYTQYLDSNLKVPLIIKSVYARAVRNCPWVEALWAKYMLALERFDTSEEELSTVFEQSLQCVFSKPDEYLDLFLTRADGLRRRVMKMDNIDKTSWLAQLRETFQRAAEYLSVHLNYTDQFLHLHAYWARLEGQLMKDMTTARGVWESLIKMSGSMLEVWQGYIDMELALNNISEARAIYKRCYSKRLKGNGSEVICEAWLRFEQEYGSLEDLDRAIMKVKPRLEELRSFHQQQEGNSRGLEESGSKGKKTDFQKTTKEKEGVHKDSSKHSDSSQASRKRKMGIGYNEDNLGSKRHKQSGGNISALQAPDTEKFGLGSINNTEIDTGLDHQTEGAKLSPVKQAMYTDECTAFVSNLPFEATEEHIRKFFSGCGVKAIRLLRERFSGKSRGLAYVDFDNEEKLSAALTKNKQRLLDKKISIARSNPNENKRAKVQRGIATSVQGGRASSGTESGTSAEDKHGSLAKPAPTLVSHRRGGHIKLTGSNTFALPRNVARPLGWGAQDNKSIESEETPKSNEEFRKMFLKS